MTFILSIVFTILGILITPYMLRMMSTPDDVIRESATYLKIGFGRVAGLINSTTWAPAFSALSAIPAIRCIS